MIVETGPAPLHSYIRAIDGLRAVAVLAVVVFHANAPWLPNGFLGVDVFFVVSGFVVPYSIMQHPLGTRWEFLGSFYRRRALRILPASLFWILISAAATVLFIPRAHASLSFFITGLAAVFGGSNIALALSGNDYFSPSAEFNPFTHTWSLGVEEQFYILFSILVVSVGMRESALHRSRALKLLVLLLTVASMAASHIALQSDAPHAFYLLDSRLWQLGSGMLLALSIDRWRPRLIAIGGKPLALVGVAALGVLALTFWVAVPGGIPFPSAIPSCLAALVLIAILVSGAAGPVQYLLASRPAVAVGQASFSIYLAHWPLMVFARWTTGLATPVQQVTAILLSLVLGFASARFIEQPFRYAPRLRALPTRLLLIGAVAAMGITALISGLGFLGSNWLTSSVTRDRAVWSGYYDRDLVKQACGVTVRPLKFKLGAPLSIAIDVTACAGRRVIAPRLFVIGDSHAGAYRRMITRTAAEMGMASRLYAKGGCAQFDLRHRNRDKAPGCGPFALGIRQELAASIRAGDVIFMPSLRVPLLVDEAGDPEPFAKFAAGLNHHAALVEVREFLTEMRARGVRVVIEAPLPVARAPLYRCSDWFNRNNPVCRAGFMVSRAEEEAHRADVVRDINALAQEFGAQVWDPMPVLCSPVKCAFRDGNVPLMWDGDHISGAANDRLAPSFIALVRGMIGVPEDRSRTRSCCKTASDGVGKEF